MKLAHLVFATALYNLPAMAQEFASAPLNKPTVPVCAHYNCSIATLLSVLPLSNSLTKEGVLFSVVYNAATWDDPPEEGTAHAHKSVTHTVVNDVVFCSKSKPAIFSHNNEEGWIRTYLHPGNSDGMGMEQWSRAIYMAACHQDLKFDAEDGTKLAHRLGYTFNAGDSVGDDDLLAEGASPYEFIATQAKTAEAKPAIKSDPGPSAKN